MCFCNTDSRSSSTFYFPIPKPRSKRLRVVRIHRLNNRRNKGEIIEEELEMKNLKLYMENMSILKENEKLRKKAALLHQENLALLSQLEKNFC